nr:hypothetical protein [Bacillus sp. MUM 116]
MLQVSALTRTMLAITTIIEVLGRAVVMMSSAYTRRTKLLLGRKK